MPTLSPLLFSMFEAARKRLGLFLALSRTPHGLIDMAAPALAALLCLGHFPSAAVAIVGLITAFAGYTAVYALNDLVDLRSDTQKVDAGGYSGDESYLDGVMMRHPMAKGALSFGAGLTWTVAWAVVALIGAYWLNPVCLYFFAAGCLLEALYCTLWRVTPWRAVINGVVKTLGALAAAYAVTPNPPAHFLAVLFAWIFVWEIGGQNIPNDWTDIEEDRRFHARTIPLALGLQKASLLGLGCLVATLFLNLALMWLSPLRFGAPYLVAAAAVNYFLLLHPALGLAERRQRRDAMALFNRASYYPLANLLLVLVRLVHA
jgi:4-hydroxybenzoate polyprenyltransferase